MVQIYFTCNNILHYFTYIHIFVIKLSTQEDLLGVCQSNEGDINLVDPLQQHLVLGFNSLNSFITMNEI